MTLSSSSSSTSSSSSSLPPPTCPPPVPISSSNVQPTNNNLPPEIITSLKLNNSSSLENSFKLYQASLSVLRARPISLALAAVNLLYSSAELLRLEPHSNQFWFVVCIRAVGGTLLLLLVYLLLHCVSNELAKCINAGHGDSLDLPTAAGETSMQNNVQAERNENQWNQPSPFDHSQTMENGAVCVTQGHSRRRRSKTLRQFATSIFPSLKRSSFFDDNDYRHASRSGDNIESQPLVDDPSTNSLSETTMCDPPDRSNNPTTCCSIQLPQLVTPKLYSYFVVVSTLILSLIGSLNVYLYPESGSQYLISLSLIFYWTVHHVSFMLPWQFAASASGVVSIPVVLVVIRLPVIYQLELRTSACFLSVVFFALVYANHHREMQSRQMFQLMEKAKADRLAVEKSAVVQCENESKSAFIANVSHEMRTPLSAVICAASLLMDGNLPAEEVCHLAKIVHATSETLSVLINDLLDLASCEANRLTLHPSPTSLADLANDTIACLAPAFALKRLDLACHVDTQLWYRNVICDRSRLSQVLVNLLNNSMKFTSIGGVALTMDVVSCDNCDDPQNATVHICIEDSGIGIPAEAISRLGSRFYQVDSGAKTPMGTGLGLSISRALIEKMGSQWTVSSILGVGTKFEFALTLPLAPSSTNASIAASELEDVLKTFSAEDEPSRWHCLVIGGSALGRTLFLKHLEHLKVAKAEDATPDKWKDNIPEIAIHSPTSIPVPSTSSSAAAPTDSAAEHPISSGEDSTCYLDLQNRIRKFVRCVQKADPTGIPVLFVDECFMPHNLALRPLKRRWPNGVAILDRSFDLEDSSDEVEAEISQLDKEDGENDACVQLFPIQVRHQLYNDRSGESFSRSSSRGMSRPLFAESATSMEYEEHVRDLETHRRSSYCSTDTIGSPDKRGSFSTDAYVSPVFWAPLHKPITARGIAMTMRTAFAARAMWRKPEIPLLTPVPSTETDGPGFDLPAKGTSNRAMSLTAAPLLREEEPRSRRLSGEAAGETLRSTARRTSPCQRPEVQPSPNAKKSSHRRHGHSGSAVRDSAVPIRVLVAEDNPVIVAVVTRILEIAGFKIEVATDGEKALKMYEKSIDPVLQRSTYGAVMMDVRMEKMDGVTCTKRIRCLESRRLRRTPILATTGHDMTQEHEVSQFDAVLQKPYDRTRLVSLLRKWTEGDSLRVDVTTKRSKNGR